MDGRGPGPVQYLIEALLLTSEMTDESKKAALRLIPLLQTHQHRPGRPQSGKARLQGETCSVDDINTTRPVRTSLFRQGRYVGHVIHAQAAVYRRQSAVSAGGGDVQTPGRPAQQ